MRRLYRLILNIIRYWLRRIQHPNLISNIVDFHFENWSEKDHVNRAGLTLAIMEMNHEKPIIVETGTSAYGTDSSRLFDAVITATKGNFYSVDINPQASRALIGQHSRRSKFYISDSVKFLNLSLPEITSHVDLFYLDSWDVDWSDPMPSAVHGLAEFNAINLYLRKGTILVVDDTPNRIDFIPIAHHKSANKFFREYGVWPGKGALILKQIQAKSSVEILWHDYNLVIKF